MAEDEYFRNKQKEMNIRNSLGSVVAGAFFISIFKFKQNLDYKKQFFLLPMKSTSDYWEWYCFFSAFLPHEIAYKTDDTELIKGDDNINRMILESVYRVVFFGIFMLLISN